MRLIAACGLICSECPAYLARKANDQNLREETAKEWSEMYNAQIKPENINCDGCHTKKGVVFSHCNRCEIRACCAEKNIDNCSKCDEYPCSKIKDFFQFVPEAKKNLEDCHH